MKISICLAAYNGERYIREQILSILPQLKVDDELIMSDGGSTDNTLSVVESIGDPRIKIVRYIPDNPSESIYSAIRNNFFNALKYASGDIIFFSDQDDVWLPDKVKTTVAEFANFTIPADKPMLVHTDLCVVDSNLKIINESFVTSTGKHPELANSKGYLYVYPVITGCTAAFNRVLQKLMLDVTDADCLHDSLCGLLTIHHGGEIRYINTPTILYRQHTNNVVGATDTGSSHRQLTNIQCSANNNRQWYRDVHKICNVSVLEYVYYKIKYKLFNFRKLILGEKLGS